MTHPQDPEQQAVEAWMEGLGFEKSVGGRIGWYHDEVFIAKDAATFFYRATQAQATEATNIADKVLQQHITEHSCGAIGCYRDFDKLMWQRFFAELHARFSPQE